MDINYSTRNIRQPSRPCHAGTIMRAHLYPFKSAVMIIAGVWIYSWEKKRDSLHVCRSLSYSVLSHVFPWASVISIHKPCPERVTELLFCIRSSSPLRYYWFIKFFTKRATLWACNFSYQCRQTLRPGLGKLYYCSRPDLHIQNILHCFKPRLSYVYRMSNSSTMLTTMGMWILRIRAANISQISATFCQKTELASEGMLTVMLSLGCTETCALREIVGVPVRKALQSSFRLPPRRGVDDMTKYGEASP